MVFICTTTKQTVLTSQHSQRAHAAFSEVEAHRISRGGHTFVSFPNNGDHANAPGPEDVDAGNHAPTTSIGDMELFLVLKEIDRTRSPPPLGRRTVPLPTIDGIIDPVISMTDCFPAENEDSAWPAPPFHRGAGGDELLDPLSFRGGQLYHPEPTCPAIGLGLVYMDQKSQADKPVSWGFLLLESVVFDR
jgi:hypothetical protein